MSNYPNMATLYKKLDDIGFDKKFVKTMLPDWWDRECEKHPTGVLEGIIYISRRLNLEIDSLIDANSQAKFKAGSQPKFKTQKGAKLEKFQISYALACRIAELAASGCKNDYQPIDVMSERDIRKEILQNKKYIDLEGVLDFCWKRGIPIIHFNQLPKGANKFDGMVIFCSNRPVIIVSLNDKTAIILLFIILHELGHVYHKHISDSCLIDEKIELSSKSQEEIEANKFANSILFVNPNTNYYNNIDVYKMSGKYLAQICKNYATQAKDDNISPESIIMNYSWYRAEDKKNKNIKDIVWATANKALKIVGAKTNAPEIINTKFKESFDWDKLSEDNEEYLNIMTGLYQ